MTPVRVFYKGCAGVCEMVITRSTEDNCDTGFPSRNALGPLTGLATE